MQATTQVAGLWAERARRVLPRLGPKADDHVLLTALLAFELSASPGRPRMHTTPWNAPAA